MRARRRRGRGQALVELALTLPLLCVLGMGTLDVGRFIADSAMVEGASRTAMRVAQTGISTDVGAAAREEPGTTLADDATTWGAAAPGGTMSCGAGSASCGDPQGCDRTSSFWTAATAPKACFAVAACTLDTSVSPPVCTGTVSWNTRPGVGSAPSVAVLVRVVMRFTPATPLISGFTPGGWFDVRRDLLALPLY